MAITGVNPSDVKKRAGSFPKLLDDGVIATYIARSLPFEQMGRAHELIEQGGFGGCVVVSIDHP